MPASTLRKTALALALAAALGSLGCSESVESLVASGDAALAKGDYRTAQIQLKSALQKDGNNARARWLLGELSLAIEDGDSAEKEIRRAGELGVGNDAVLPALAQALLLQGKVDAVVELAQPPDLSPRSRGEVMAAQGLALLAKGEKGRAEELTAEALKLATDSKFATTARVRLLADANKLDEAEQLLAGLQAKFPDYGLAWSLMGDIKDLRGDLPRAEEAYTTAMKTRGNALEDQFKRASVRLAQQNLDGALADSQTLNKALPNLQPAWFVTGAVHFLKKDFAKAEEALGRSYQLDNDHVQTLILLGWVNLNLGNTGQALEQANRVVAVAPNLVAPRLLMGILDLKQGRPKQAEDVVRPVVDGLPDFIPAKVLLANTLQAQGRGAEAAPYLEQIAAARPESADVQTAVALDLLRARKPDKALAVLERALGRTPDAPQANVALVASLIQEKKFDEALAAAQRFLDQKPEDLVGLRLVASVHRAAGNTEKAKSAFRQALAVSPGDSLAAVGLAEQLAHENDLDGARKALEGALSRSPDDAGLMTVLSQVAVKQGRTVEAKALLTNAVKTAPGHAVARLLLGQLLLSENDPKAALELLPSGANLMDARLLALRAQANLRLKEYARAREDLERLAAIQPGSAALQFQLATVYAALGEQDKMATALDAAASLAPTDPAVGLAQARALLARGKIAEAAAAVGRLKLPESHPGRLAVEVLISAHKGDLPAHVRLSEALFDNQPTSETVLVLAQARLAAGQKEAAEQVLRTWVGQHPQDGTVAFALAGMLGRSGRESEAVALLRPLLAGQPDSVPLLNNLAWYLRDSAPSEALGLAQKAAARAPDDAGVLDTYAVVLARNRQFDKALTYINRAIAEAKEPAYLLLQRVDILIDSGDQARAAEALAAVEAAGVPEPLRPWAEALAKRIGVTP